MKMVETFSKCLPTVKVRADDVAKLIPVFAFLLAIVFFIVLFTFIPVPAPVLRNSTAEFVFANATHKFLGVLIKI